LTTVVQALWLKATETASCHGRLSAEFLAVCTVAFTVCNSSNHQNLTAIRETITWAF